MSKWDIVLVILDVTIAFIGLYCLAVGERHACAVIIGILMYDACRGRLGTERREE